MQNLLYNRPYNVSQWNSVSGRNSNCDGDQPHNTSGQSKNRMNCREMLSIILDFMNQYADECDGNTSGSQRLKNPMVFEFVFCCSITANEKVIARVHDDGLRHQQEQLFEKTKQEIKNEYFGKTFDFGAFQLCVHAFTPMAINGGCHEKYPNS